MFLSAIRRGILFGLIDLIFLSERKFIISIDTDGIKCENKNIYRLNFVSENEAVNL